MPYTYASNAREARRIRTAVYDLGATSISTLRDGREYRVSWDDETISADAVTERFPLQTAAEYEAARADRRAEVREYVAKAKAEAVR